MKDIRPYYNTNQVSPQLLMIYEGECLRQEDAVLEVYQKVKEAAWFQVAGCLPWMHEDSLGRSITNLKNRKFLEKVRDKGTMLIGPSGKPCHIYRITAAGMKQQIKKAA